MVLTELVGEKIIPSLGVAFADLFEVVAGEARRQFLQKICNDEIGTVSSWNKPTTDPFLPMGLA